MRNITVFTVLVIMFNCAQIAAAQEEQTEEKQPRSYTFSTWTSFGLFYGQAEEIVYPSPNHKAELLSELLWDMKPVFYYGFSLDFSRVRPWEKWGFFATLSLKNGIPGKSGEMEDKDWDSIENNALTHYSVHDNVTNTLFFFDVSAGFSFPFNQFLILKTFVTMSYMRFSFTGQYGHGTYARQIGGNGSGIYASMDDNPTYVSFSNWEKVINYSQNWLSVAPGIAAGFYYSRFYYEWSLSVSPLVSCTGVDEHITTSAQYKDYMRGGLFVEHGSHFSFIASRRLEFSLDFSWRYTGGARGETWMSSPIGTATSTQEGKAGAGLSLSNFGLCMKIRL